MDRPRGRPDIRTGIKRFAPKVQGAANVSMRPLHQMFGVFPAARENAEKRSHPAGTAAVSFAKKSFCRNVLGVFREAGAPRLAGKVASLPPPAAGKGLVTRAHGSALRGPEDRLRPVLIGEVGPGLRGCQEIRRADKFVVPAKAGTQGQVIETPRFPLSRERRKSARAPNAQNWIAPFAGKTTTSQPVVGFGVFASVMSADTYGL